MKKFYGNILEKVALVTLSVRKTHLWLVTPGSVEIKKKCNEAMWKTKELFSVISDKKDWAAKWLIDIKTRQFSAPCDSMCGIQISITKLRFFILVKANM